MFAKPVVYEEGVNYGEFQGQHYPINDGPAAFFYDAWLEINPTKESDIKQFVRQILTHKPFWDQNMAPFIAQTSHYLLEFSKSNVRGVLATVVN